MDIVKVFASNVKKYRNRIGISQESFAEKAGLPDKLYWHAEGLALVRCKDKVPYRLTVERYDNQGEQALAAPCPVCKEMIKTWGVKILEYTSPNGWVKEVL